MVADRGWRIDGQWFLKGDKETTHAGANFSPTGVLTLAAGGGPRMLEVARTTLEALARRSTPV